MKKNLAKILASASAVVALILIVILIVTAFGGIKTEEFESKLVRGLLISIALLYFAIIGVTLALMFIQGEALHEVVIKKENGGSARVNASVFKKMIKKAIKEIDGVKCKKVALYSDGYGVRLKLNVSIKQKDVDETDTLLRTIIDSMFYDEFRYRFSSVDINIMQLIPKWVADQEAIDAEVQKILAEKRAAEEELAEKSKPAEAPAPQPETPAEEHVAHETTDEHTAEPAPTEEHSEQED